MRVLLQSIAALALAPLAHGAIAEHEVSKLPGFDGPLPSKHYSGYLPVGATSGVPGYIHYWLILSENDPENDPIMYWTNGGPGGSGIQAGLLTEMGQVHVNENSFSADSDEIKVFYNPYSWNQNASVVYVSQPKGVGFSYCDDSVAEKDCQNDDETSAYDAYDFFVAFFAAYPELATNDFYLTAESYGGIYIPTFMREIDQRGGVPNFKGAAIGDGCWGTDVGMCAFGTGKSNEIEANMFFGHNMIDEPLYDGLVAECTDSSGEWVDESDAPKACLKLLAEMNVRAGTFDIYNIYDTCAGDTATRRTLREWRELLFKDRSITIRNLGDATAHPAATVSGALNDYPCGNDRAATAWLSQDSVAEALHVNMTMANKGMKYTWGPSSFSGDLTPVYKDLIEKGYRMMIYSGDTDACIPTWGTMEWTRELGFKEKSGWRQWQSALSSESTTLQRAGYIIDYTDESNNIDFKVVTVQGAGHLVPTYKPLFSLTMINSFIFGLDF